MDGERGWVGAPAPRRGLRQRPDIPAPRCWSPPPDRRLTRPPLAAVPLGEPSAMDGERGRVGMDVATLELLGLHEAGWWALVERFEAALGLVALALGGFKIGRAHV